MLRDAYPFNSTWNTWKVAGQYHNFKLSGISGRNLKLETNMDQEEVNKYMKLLSGSQTTDTPVSHKIMSRIMRLLSPAKKTKYDQANNNINCELCKKNVQSIDTVTNLFNLFHLVYSMGISTHSQVGSTRKKY